MNNILRLDTGVQYMEGFSRLKYRIFTIDSPTDQPSSIPTPLKTRAHYAGLQSILSRSGLAFYDQTEQTIWVFDKQEKASNTHPSARRSEGRKPIEKALVPECSGTTFRLSYSGTILASSFEKNVLENDKRMSLQNQKKALLEGQSPQVPAVYSSFISSVVCAISYRQSREFGIYPVGQHTFLVPCGGKATPFHKSQLSKASCLGSLDISLNNLGILIVSFRLLQETLWGNLYEKGLLDLFPTPSTRKILLSPIGSIGVEVNDGHPPSSRLWLDQSSWKTQVSLFLDSQGIQIPKLIEDSSWAIVKVLSEVETETGDGAGSIIFWPKQLCVVALESDASPLVGFTSHGLYLHRPVLNSTGQERLTGLETTWLPTFLDEARSRLLETATPAMEVSGIDLDQDMDNSTALPFVDRNQPAITDVVVDKNWLEDLLDSEEGSELESSDRMFPSVLPVHARSKNGAAGDMPISTDQVSGTVGNIYQLESLVSKANAENAPPSAWEPPHPLDLSQVNAASLKKPLYSASQTDRSANSVYPESVHTDCSRQFASELDAKYRPGGFYSFGNSIRPHSIQTDESIQQAVLRIKTPQRKSTSTLPTLRELRGSRGFDSIDSDESDGSENVHNEEDVRSVFPHSHTHTTPINPSRRTQSFFENVDVPSVPLQYLDLLTVKKYHELTKLHLVHEYDSSWPLFKEGLLQKEELEQVLRLAVDQYSLTTLSKSSVFSRYQKWIDAREATRTFRKSVRDAATHYFPKRESCDFLHYLLIQDRIPLIGGITNVKAKMKGMTTGVLDKELGPKEYIFKLPLSNIRVGRKGLVWDMAPSSLPFWTSLGLEPVGGPKNILSCSLIPRMVDKDGRELSLMSLYEQFLVKVSSSYQSGRLGLHPIHGRFGVGPRDIVEFNIMSCEKDGDLLEICTSVGSHLGSAATDIGHIYKETQALNFIVVYIVDPLETPSSLRQCCYSFMKLRDSYFQKLAASAAHGNVSKWPKLVLQIVPLTTIAQNPTEHSGRVDRLSTFCREVYSRCEQIPASTNSLQMTNFSSGPILLADQAPHVMNFKEDKVASSVSARNQPYFHLGYTVSPNNKWLSVAWTDNVGRYQGTAAYQIDKAGHWNSVFGLVWKDTLKMVGVSKLQSWQFCITKIGPLDTTEAAIWHDMVVNATKISPCVMIMSVDPQSHHTVSSLHSAGIKPGLADPSQGIPRVRTKREPTVPHSDLSKDENGQARMVLREVEDCIWGVVLNRRLRNSRSMNTYRPFLASGLLVGRAEEISESDAMGSGSSSPRFNVISCNLVTFWPAHGGATKGPSQSRSTPAGPKPVGSAKETLKPELTDGNPALRDERGNKLAMSTPVAPGLIPPMLVWTDVILREVLMSYSRLSTLSRVRGVVDRTGLLPWHLAVAVRTAEVLEPVYFRSGTKAEGLM